MNEPIQYGGVNHVALVCRDMAETVDFYERVLEMPLVKTIELPNDRGQHFFFDRGGGDCIAFFWFPNAPEAAPGIASMHPDYKSKGRSPLPWRSLMNTPSACAPKGWP